MTGNAYQQTAQRFENISRNFKLITDAAAAVIEWASSEYDSAQDALREHEEQPGIPRPEYRGQDSIGDPAWPDGCPIPFDLAKAALQTRLTSA